MVGNKEGRNKLFPLPFPLVSSLLVVSVRGNGMRKGRGMDGIGEASINRYLSLISRSNRCGSSRIRDRMCKEGKIGKGQWVGGGRVGMVLVVEVVILVMFIGSLEWRYVRDNRLLITLRPYIGTLLAPPCRLITLFPTSYHNY